VRDAFAYEWTRIRTLRSTWWLTAGAVVLGVAISGLFSWAVARAFDTATVEDIDVLGPAVVTQLAATGEIPSIVCFLVAILGIFAWGHEYRHGMIRASLTALSSRSSLGLAKFAVVGAWVAATVLVTLLLAGLVGSFFLREHVTVFTGQTWSVIARQVLYGVVLVWLAMAFTSLTRSQAFALVMIFLWPLLVESLVNLFFFLVPALRSHTSVLRFLPFDAGGHVVDVLSHPTSTFGDPLSPLGGAVVFGGVAAVLMAASYALFLRRDA
jgi:ABC-type transport system involved in multi-copper enzyme maturation permease subunit